MTFYLTDPKVAQSLCVVMHQVCSQLAQAGGQKKHSQTSQCARYEE